MSAGLDSQGVNLARSGKAVLHDVDLTIAPGRITALLGANGAGKSSLVLAIAGVLPVAAGQILARRASDRRACGRKRSVRWASPRCRRAIRCSATSASRTISRWPVAI